MNNLNKYLKNIKSQAGEDGIIEYLCDKMALDKGWCVEFGAWDGEYLSNTYNLVMNKRFSSVLIEGKEDRYAQLKEKFAARSDIIPLNAYVGYKDDDSCQLDKLLKNTPLKRNFELLSIDVDGDDWYIWKSLTNFQPKIVIIESNSTYNYDDYHVGAPGSGGGASALAMTELGKEKGYELVAHTGNCIFVKKEYYHLIGLDDNSLVNLFTNKFYLQKTHDAKLRVRAGRFIERWLNIIMNKIKRALSAS